MANIKNVALVATVVAMAAIVIFLKQSKQAALETAQSMNDSAATSVLADMGDKPVHTAQAEKLPRLVDLGAHSCIPCKMMAPILDDLKREYASVFTTEFIDVWQNQDAGRKYGVKVIPTQIFYDAAGKELFRHEGFFGKEDIISKWQELGVNFPAKGAITER